MIVLDTNALIRWVSNPGKLSRKARKAIDEEDKKQSIYVSSMTVLEIYTLLRKDRLELNTLQDSWLERIESIPSVTFIPIDNQIIVQSVNLPDFPHKDPADRIIIATALNLGARLITSDRKILDYPHVQSMW